MRIPHNFSPRRYQVPFLRAMDSGKKRAMCVWHRRSGKDKTFLNFMVKKMFERIGIYYYFFPNYNQGRKIMWDGIDRDGFKYMDHIPEDLRLKTNKQEMKITLVNGSIFQIVGTDNIDSVVGTNPVGCVFSEFSLQNPQAWDFIRPILLENEGWAVFNCTPRGRNHAFSLYQMASRNESWFAELLTVDDTRRADGTPVITQEMIEAERAEGMEESLIQQEYWCSFEAALASCFFADTLARHKSTTRGVAGNLEKEGFVKDFKGIMEVWRYPYTLLDSYKGIDYLYRYTLGVDVGEGLGQEHSVGYVYDRHLKEFVCRMRSNKIDAYSWGDMMKALSEYYCNAFIVPERDGAGITTCKRLYDTNSNVYVKQVPAKIGGGFTKVVGWQETRDAKYDACGDLKTFFRTTPGHVYDEILLQECSTFIVTETKRLEHDVGFSDDCVIAAALALQGNYLLPPVEKVDPPLTGWKADLENKEQSGWAV